MLGFDPGKGTLFPIGRDVGRKFRSAINGKWGYSADGWTDFLLRENFPKMCTGMKAQGNGARVYKGCTKN